jgi:flagellar protein FlaG
MEEIVMVSEVTNKIVIPVQSQVNANVVEFKSPKKLEASEFEDSSIALSSITIEENTANSQEMENTADRLNEIAQDIRRDLEFKVDDNSGDMVITVLDRETNEVIRQIPQEHVLALRENMESLKGILFSAKI